MCLAQEGQGIEQPEALLVNWANWLWTLWTRGTIIGVRPEIASRLFLQRMFTRRATAHEFKKELGNVHAQTTG